MNPPVYKQRPIGSISSLAKALEVQTSELLVLEREVDDYYLPNQPVVKPNGSIRQTYTIKQPLKKIQRQLLKHIFYHVSYPNYLQGSIKDVNSPRDYIVDSSLHLNKRIIISEDIHKFFPSIDESLVFKMWQYFFNFPVSVAQILTQLTTYKGMLPEGASTSSYIANLIFWDKEPQLEYELRERELCYSRYVDDITISTKKFVDKTELKLITTKVYEMLRSSGVTPNLEKRKIQTNSKRMTVHNINVNSVKPTINKKERSQIRAAVKQCEEKAKTDRSSPEYQKLYRSVTGRVARLRRLHKKVGEQYYRRLLAIQPILED